MRNLLFRHLFPAMILLLVCGCVQHKVEESQMGMGLTSTANFPKLERYKLELTPVNHGLMAAGKDTKVTYVLRNLDTIPVAIPEWYSNEADNIEIDCQIWYPDMAMPINNAWMTLPVTVKQPPLRYPLKLGSQMFVAIEVPLDFLNNLVVERGTERRYFLQARLNLNSVSATSRYSSIIIRNPADMPKTGK